MLKILKYDYKLLLLLPLILTTCLTLINIVLMCITAFIQLDSVALELILDICNYSIYLTIAVSLLYIGIILLIKELTKYKLYTLTDTPSATILLTRFLTYFLTILIITLLGMLQATLLHSLAVSSNQATINVINLNFFIFSMLFRPALSWLMCVAVAYVSCIIYSFILIIASLNKMLLNKKLRKFTIVLTTITLFLAFLAFNTYNEEMSNNLNYNVHNFISVYIPEFSISFIITNQINPFFLFIANIFNIYFVVFSVLFIVFSIIIYWFKNKNRFASKFKNKNSFTSKFKNIKRYKTIKIINIVVIAILSLTFIGYPIYTFAKINFWTTPNINLNLELPRQLYIMDVGDKISLDDYINEHLTATLNKAGNKAYKNILPRAKKRFSFSMINPGPNSFQGLFIDKDRYLHARKAGVYNYGLILNITYSEHNYSKCGFLNLTVIIKDTNYSDYKEVFTTDDIDSSEGKYILMDNLTIDYYEQRFDTKRALKNFNGTIVNPYRFAITLNDRELFDTLDNNALIDGLIIYTNYEKNDHFSRQSSLAQANKGAIINSYVYGNIKDDYVGGIVYTNRGVLYNNTFNGTIEAISAGGIAMKNNRGIIENNTSIVTFKNLTEWQIFYDGIWSKYAGFTTPNIDVDSLDTDEEREVFLDLINSFINEDNGKYVKNNTSYVVFE